MRRDDDDDCDDDDDDEDVTAAGSSRQGCTRLDYTAGRHGRWSKGKRYERLR